MKKLVLLPVFVLLCYAAAAQSLDVKIAGGIIGTPGPANSDTRSAGNSAYMIGDIGLAGTKGAWTAGAGLAVFEMKQKVNFLFESAILPDNSTHIYDVAMGKPTYNPYLYGGRNFTLEEHVYISVALRGGMLLTGRQEPSPYTPYHGFNSDGELIMQPKPCFSYGLQTGLNVQASRTITAGVNFFWQQAHTSSHINYNTTYAVLGPYGLPVPFPYNIDKHMSYTISTMALQIFLRFSLYYKKDSIGEAEETE